MIAFDFLGFGLSAKPPNHDYSLFWQADLTEELVRRYGIVAEHLETMLAQARARSSHGFGLPRHVEQTFRRYIDCGYAL